MLEISSNRKAQSRAEMTELLREVRRIEMQSRRLVRGAMAGGYASVFRGSGVEFSEVREYSEGDDPRSVDWNVTARVGRPFVKKFVDERERTMLFLLDLSPSMEGGFGVWSARQMAARVCACLALSAARHHDKIGLVAFGGQIEHFVPPRKGPGHALRIVRDCLALPASSGKADLAQALEFVSHVVRRRSVVFVISDFLGGIDDKPLALGARRHDLIAMRLLSPELDPPFGGMMRLRDPESGHTALVDWGHAPARDAYALRVKAWNAGVEQALDRAKVDRVDLPIPRVPNRDAVAKPILDFFRMRELRGAKR